MTQHSSIEDDNSSLDDEEEPRLAVNDEHANDLQNSDVGDLMSHPESTNLLSESGRVDLNHDSKGIVWAHAQVASIEGNVDHGRRRQLSASEIVTVTSVHVVPVEIDNETMMSPDSSTLTTASSEYSSPPLNMVDNLSNNAACRLQQHPASISPPLDMVDNLSNIEACLIDAGDDFDHGHHVTPAELTYCSLYRWNFLVFVIGNSLLVSALASTFALEVGACTLYVVGSIFHWFAESLAMLGQWTVLLQTVSRLFSTLFLSIDLLLLTMSAFLVEVLSWMAGMLCVLFGGITVGFRMRQHIGSVCQTMRDPFRSFHADWSPKRMQPLDFEKDSQGE